MSNAEACIFSPLISIQQQATAQTTDLHGYRITAFGIRIPRLVFRCQVSAESLRVLLLGHINAAQLAYWQRKVDA